LGYWLNLIAEAGSSRQPEIVSEISSRTVNSISPMMVSYSSGLNMALTNV
jgi:hypothetical protein